jgi:hypothetical protein
MTIEQYIQMLNKQIMEVETIADHAIFLAASSNMGDIANRIFVEGRDADGAKIGSYNTTKPLYVSPKDSPRNFKPQGKNGDTGKVRNKARKTKYFSSYREYRNNQQRQTMFVDLRMFGRLQGEFESSLRRVTDGIGWQIGVYTKENINKARGNERRFNTIIFEATRKEAQDAQNIAAQEMTDYLNR